MIRSRERASSAAVILPLRMSMTAAALRRAVRRLTSSVVSFSWSHHPSLKPLQLLIQRVALVIGGGCIRRQFHLRGGACGAWDGRGGLWVQPNSTRAAIRTAAASHANKGSRSADEGWEERRLRCLDKPPASSP